MKKLNMFAVLMAALVTFAVLDVRVGAVPPQSWAEIKSMILGIWPALDTNSANDQPLDADLTTWAAVTPSANGQSLVQLTYAGMRTNLSLVVGSNVQAYDADLTTWAGVTPSANGQSLVQLTYAGMRTNLNLVVGSDVQAYDADLTTWAGVTPSANGQSLVATTYAGMRTNLSLVVGANVQAYDADLDDLADGSLTATKVAAGYDAAGLSGDIAAARLATNLKAAISNLFTSVSINGTNFYMLAYP